MSKRRNHNAGFKARVVLETVKGERTVSELAAEDGEHPTMIHRPENWPSPTIFLSESGRDATTSGYPDLRRFVGVTGDLDAAGVELREGFSGLLVRLPARSVGPRKPGCDCAHLC